jgi:hypothetical protein
LFHLNRWDRDMMSQPSGFLREMAKAGTDDTVMVAYFAPPRSPEEPRRVVRVGLNVVAEAMGFLVVDHAKRRSSGQGSPRRSLVSV